jgi:hypothetical protein
MGKYSRLSEGITAMNTKIRLRTIGLKIFLYVMICQILIVYIDTSLYLYAQNPQTNQNPTEASQKQVLSITPTNQYPIAKRYTVQNRFAQISKAMIVHTSFVTHQRDDYYDSVGFGLGASYFFNEKIGINFRWNRLFTSLGDEVTPFRNQGLVPDAAPQKNWILLGAEYALGYGKLLSFQNIFQFDAIFSFHLGFATADERYIPTALLSFSPIFYLKSLFKLRFDLGLNLQVENRTKGNVWSTGFVPGIGLSWGGTFDEIAQQIKKWQGK